jgi:SOS-response transcriptional repressor LexA
MSSFSDWLLRRMELVGLRSQADLAEVSGIAPRTISRVITSGTLEKAERSTRVWLARTLKVSLRELERLDSGEITTIPDSRVFEWDHVSQGRVDRIAIGSPVIPAGSERDGVPVVGRVAAGGMVESYEDWDADAGKRLPLQIPGVAGVYALEICGDSMEPAYNPGEYVILKNIAVTELQDGEDAMVQLDGDNDGKSAFKRVYILGEGRLKLVSLNQKYDPIDVSAATVIRVGRLQGKFTPPKLIINSKSKG